MYNHSSMKSHINNTDEKTNKKMEHEIYNIKAEVSKLKEEN